MRIMRPLRSSHRASNRSHRSGQPNAINTDVPTDEVPISWKCLFVTVVLFLAGLWFIATKPFGISIEIVTRSQQASHQATSPDVLLIHAATQAINSPSTVKPVVALAAFSNSSDRHVDVNSSSVDVNSFSVDVNSSSVDVNSSSVDVNSSFVDVNSSSVDVNSFSVDVNSSSDVGNATIGSGTLSSLTGDNKSTPLLQPGRDNSTTDPNPFPTLIPTTTPAPLAAASATAGDVIQTSGPVALVPRRNLTCVSLAAVACDHKGMDRCRWTPTNITAECDLFQLPTSMHPVPFDNISIAFHGDSTLREQFHTMTSFYCPGQQPISKADTNMAKRAVIYRYHSGKQNSTMTTVSGGQIEPFSPSVEFEAAFRFDYSLDHLSLDGAHDVNSTNRLLYSENRSQRDDFAPLRRRPDVVVVGLGLYYAKQIARNVTISINLTSAQSIYTPGNTVTLEDIRNGAKRIVSLVCDGYKSPFGFYVATAMECWMLKTAAYRNYKKGNNGPYHQCTQDYNVLKMINVIMEEQLAVESAKRTDGCKVMYVIPLKCLMFKRPCTGDGIHARSGGFYAYSRFQVLANAIRSQMLHPNQWMML